MREWSEIAAGADEMTTTAVVILIAVIIVVAVAVLFFLRQERSKKLRSRFGPEYDHAVREFGSQYRAEDALLKRQRRIEKTPIRSLSPEERDKFAQRWHDVQARFVDDPAGSIRDADALVNETMLARGYPMTEFDNRAEDLSVDYPHVISNYRAAHAIAMHRDAGTENLRQGLVYYRELFDELLEAHTTTPTEPRRLKI